MPDHRKHRGAHPADSQLFASDQLPMLRKAVADLSWLLSRDYAVNASLKLVGDRYNLRERQRMAVVRAAASEAHITHRTKSLLPMSAIQGRAVVIDGFNLIITIEAALSGGVIVLSRDGCYRDLSSIHGSYRSVEETESAVQLLGEVLTRHQPDSVLWLLDQPVSNSGRLAARLRQIATIQNWPWEVEVVMNPDRTICTLNMIALTSDSNVLDGVKHWINATEMILQTSLPEAWIIDLQSVDAE